MTEWWEKGRPQRGDSFVRVQTDGSKVLLAAGRDEYEEWGEVELIPDMAEQVAAWLMDAARIARDGGRDEPR